MRESSHLMFSGLPPTIEELAGRGVQLFVPVKGAIA
jgi:hypothetical protein